MQTQKCNVIVFGCAVVVGVKDHLLNISDHLIGIEAVESLFPQIHSHSRLSFPERKKDIQSFVHLPL